MQVLLRLLVHDPHEVPAPPNISLNPVTVPIRRLILWSRYGLQVSLKGEDLKQDEGEARRTGIPEECGL